MLERSEGAIEGLVLVLRTDMFRGEADLEDVAGFFVIDLGVVLTRGEDVAVIAGGGVVDVEPGIFGCVDCVEEEM